MVIKQFLEYLGNGVVRSVSPDLQRAASLFAESEKKLVLLDKHISALGVIDETANDHIEYCYNILMFRLRAYLYKQGYSSSGHGAHEAEVAYSRELGFAESEVVFFDELRYFRNGILYYGKHFDASYAQKVISFTKQVCFGKMSTLK